MSAKRDKFTKGRRTKKVTMAKLGRKKKDSSKNAVRVTRKQRDVSTSGGRRRVNKDPRKVPPEVAAGRRLAPHAQGR
jgi:hypothetical protein